MSGRSAPERLNIARQPEHLGVFRHISISSSLTLSPPHALAEPDVPRVHAPVRSLQAEFVLRSRTPATPPQGRRSNPASPPPLPRSGNHHSPGRTRGYS